MSLIMPLLSTWLSLLLSCCSLSSLLCVAGFSRSTLDWIVSNETSRTLSIRALGVECFIESRVSANSDSALLEEKLDSFKISLNLARVCSVIIGH